MGTGARVSECTSNYILVPVFIIWFAGCVDACGRVIVSLGREM